MGLVKAALAAVFLLASRAAFAVELTSAPEISAPVRALPVAPALLWTAAGLPDLAPATWLTLQQGDAASLYASAIVAERLAAEPAYKGTLAAALPQSAAAALETAAVARVAAAGPARLAQARVAVLRQAPLAVPRAGDGQDLSDLSRRLDAFFDVSKLSSEDGGIPVPGVAALGAWKTLPPATPRSDASKTPASPPSPARAAAPKKALGLIDLVALGVNSIIGAGIFIKPAEMFKVAGPASVFAFPITALLLVPVALAFAEAGTYFHGKDGGAYQYTRGAFPETGAGAKAGEWASFSVTWLAWIALLFGWAAVSSVIGMNLAYFVPGLANPWAGKALAAAAIAGISYVNFRGVKEGAAVSNAFALAKLLPMLAFIAVGLTMIHPVAIAAAAPIKLAALGSASFMAFFALQGFENIAVPGGEVDEPARNIPRAIVLSLLIASLVYAGIQVVAVGLTPALAGSTKPVVDAGWRMMGALGAGAMALCAFFSTTGDSAAAALFGARFIKVLADDDHLPGSAQIRKIHPRFGTPHVAIALTSALTIASLFLPLDTLMDVSSIAVAAQYIGTCLALPFLRRRHAAPAGAFRLPGGPLIPILGAASALALSVAGGFGSLAVDLGLLAVGLALKGAWSIWRGRSVPDNAAL